MDGSQSSGPPHAPYAIYGTPIPPHDSNTRDDGSYKPEWKQEVRDDKGRKRLHGAFTGGYSAGLALPEHPTQIPPPVKADDNFRYFNTAGSSEGWTPTTFKSSRKDRDKDKVDGEQSHKRARPEDFMDEEDLRERNEDQSLEIQGAFAGLGVRDTTSSKGMFSDIFKTVEETMGVKLLERMGWRQGQGVGPMVERRAHGDKTGEMHMFAPQDTPMMSFIKKTDRMGLGHAGERSLESLVGRGAKDEDEGSDRDARILSINRNRVSKPSKIRKKSTMGVGVLNDTGSDDEDPYSSGLTIVPNKKKPEKKKAKPASSTSTAAKLQPASIVDGFQVCHDGRRPLKGFVLSKKPPVTTENPYPPPTVPAGWKPKRATKFDQQTTHTFTSTADAARASTLNAASRGAIIGEARLPGQSVFDFIKPADRDKLASASGRTNLPQARGLGAPAGFGESSRTTSKMPEDSKMSDALSQRFAPAAASSGAPGAPAQLPPKPLDPAEEAAKRGDFGELTRSTHNFEVPRLLLKRFGL